jgi:hypothetical protein
MGRFGSNLDAFESADGAAQAEARAMAFCAGLLFNMPASADEMHNS